MPGEEAIAMTVLAPSLTAFNAAEPQVRQWTRAEFYRLAELGFLQGQRAELIEGTIMVLSPQNWPHASTVDRVAEVLRQALPAGFWIRTQLPLNLNQTNELEPDISVVLGKRDDYRDHPTSAALIVEVSDSTLTYDRGPKASLYARAGLADYWIVDIAGKRLEVRRAPASDATQVFGYGYTSVVALIAPATISPLAASRVQLAVTDLIA
jgi:Uma2 family endonuclease